MEMEAPSDGLLVRTEPAIDQSRYFKFSYEQWISPPWLRGIKDGVCGVYSPEPRAEVYCLRLEFKIPTLANYIRSQKQALLLFYIWRLFKV